MSEKPVRVRTRPSTSRDVARLAGVSRSAVSRTFTAGASVAPETRSRVLEAARTLRYRPNLVARALITRRSKIVAFAVTHLDNHFYPALVQHVSETLGEAGYRLLLYVTHGEESDEPMLDELIRYGVDGLILASRGFAPTLLAGCDAAGLPVLMLNNAADTSHACVVGDNISGAAVVARFLLAGGHGRFAYLAGIPGVSSSDERMAGFAAALRSAGTGEPRVIDSAFDFATAFQACGRAFVMPDRPDALFCANDHMAFAAIEAAKHTGLVAGRDISIVGFDDVPVSSWPSIALTTYAQPSRTIARAVTDLIEALIEDRPAHPPTFRVPGSLVVRNSARRPATGLGENPDGSLTWSDPDHG